ncbi:hypothetical protein V496_01560 [Pseudogymnoascus sp. VKM F-4515 (FW-2607)]|nr:hypothetical protein V496_01560 [Pseudogymnoascus sp. VKM F-4515 (FW-2607)]
MEDDELNTQHQVESTASALSSDDIELRRLHRPAGSTPDSNYSDVRPWATKGVRNPGIATFGETDKGGGQRHKNAKAQEIMDEALFGGYCDEIEDLEPTERDALVNVAFQHEALRAKRPNVWVPRDDLGMSPLNREEVSAIEALLALGYQTGDSFKNQRVNTCLISNIENGHHTHVTLATNLKTTTTITKDASPAEYLFYPQYCTGAEVYVSMEDCGTSSIDAEFWRKYLAEFPGESLSRISTDGSKIGGEGEPSGSTFKLGYGEAFADGYGEEWAKIYNREINDLFPENWAVSNNHVASLELGMNWEEWSELIDEQQKEKLKMCKKNSTRKKTRHQPLRVGVTKVLKYRRRKDCLPQKLVKLKVGKILSPS